MPGKKSKKKSKGKKQTTSSEFKSVNPTKQEIEVKESVETYVDLNDAIIEDVIVGQGINNNNAEKIPSSFDNFVSKFSEGENSKEGKTVESMAVGEESIDEKSNSSSKSPDPDCDYNYVDKTMNDFLDLGVPEEIAYMKHPLANTWVFWWYKNDKSLSWEQNQQMVTAVDTIEDFWQVYNYIEPASMLGRGCDYAVFKKGIQPDWEDFQNMSGGRWMVVLDKKISSELLDNHWLEILFILIGEHADEFAPLVNGAVINIRPKNDKIAVWLRDSSNHKGVVEIGKLIKSRLGLRDRINFSIHREDKESQNRSRYGSQNSPSKIFV